MSDEPIQYFASVEEAVEEIRQGRLKSSWSTTKTARARALCVTVPYFFRRHGEVALVLAVFVVHQDDLPPRRISSTASSTLANWIGSSDMTGWQLLGRDFADVNCFSEYTEWGNCGNLRL